MKNSKIFSAHIFLLFLLQFFSLDIISQQIEIPRIKSMPDLPQPYLMRDWNRVALGYDSLVFNSSSTGQYLPLIFFRNNTVNYPDISFGLHTVVGTSSPSSGEAINVLPAVISATLVGIDKSNQNGYDWVKMCREYFNNRPEQNVYKNHPVDDTYDDWWYETMPNVFFYQLFDLYPNTLDFPVQFVSVADQFLESVKIMGGSAAPWKKPYMNYRGWNFETMTPFDSGVKEPEAAGAIGWILYNAYKETNDVKYRIGAEWAMEYLNGLSSNPSYELQLPYGVYTAAKMNAELGTNYDIEKMVNWCFNVGPLRDWGAILGNWGGIDVSGIIGEVNGSNDYAFLMNTFEQASALIPVIRYDERFANSIGKWMLNAANAARLFYPNYLPKFKQDSEEWSDIYDPNSYIGHEALRQEVYNVSPFGTGDAMAGGWGATNLALYASSHAGIYGGIIDTTNIEGILKLDLLKTDYFQENSYPTYLYYNPYPEGKNIKLDIGPNNKAIYESISNNFLNTNVSGAVELYIPPKNSILIVLVPSGKTSQYSLNKLIVDGIVVDYNSGQSILNNPPRVKSLSAVKQNVLKGDSVKIYCTAVDPNQDNINYSWKADAGLIYGEGEVITWELPTEAGEYKIEVAVRDNNGGFDSAKTVVNVIENFNEMPVINGFDANPRKIDLEGETQIKCNATDADNDELIYEWSSAEGNISGTGSIINWKAPNQAGNYFVVCKVTDGKSAHVIDSLAISVRDLSIQQSGNLISFYPFNQNVNDESGNNLNGNLSGASFTRDRFGNDNSALIFDGINDNVRISSNSLLNFTKSMSINYWMKIGELYEREQYVLSHGNWERRWKISISNNRLRFTIKTTVGIVDLDSETILVKNTLYNITALYSGSELEIYINGKLDAFKYHSG
ncbi:MAG: LamG domain-containing protein, partial [Melioribacteraceae bacterium]|nr:LamG domain-containing protein [Melioribacteraceae bacterium]